MSKKNEIEGDELKWFDKVVALLNEDKKRQWQIGDALLEGERFVLTGVSGKLLHETGVNVNSNKKNDADDEKVPYQLSVGGHNPYEAVAAETGYDKSTLVDYCRVARAFPASKRESELSWSHHQAVAAEWLSAKQREDLLHGAQHQKWSLAELRRQVRVFSGDEIADSDKGEYHQLSFKLPASQYQKLEKIAKREKRKLPNLLEQAVEMLFQHFDSKKKLAA